jgi:hypothetical protein
MCSRTCRKTPPRSLGHSCTASANPEARVIGIAYNVYSWVPAGMPELGSGVVRQLLSACQMRFGAPHGGDAARVRPFGRANNSSRVNFLAILASNPV